MWSESYPDSHGLLGGSVRTTGEIKAKGAVAATAEGVVNVETVKTDTGDVTLQSKRSDVTAANVQSGQNFSATAGGTVRTTGEIKAKGAAKLQKVWKS